MTKSTKIRLICSLMLFKLFIEDNDFYSFNQFFYNFNEEFTDKICGNQLFKSYYQFSESLKCLLNHQSDKAIDILLNLFKRLNQGDQFLEEKVLTFLAYAYVKIQQYDKAIQYYSYKEEKIGISKIEQYNYKLSQLIFNASLKDLKKVEEILKNIDDILPSRIDTKIYKVLLLVQKEKSVISKFIEKHLGKKFQQILMKQIRIIKDQFVKLNDGENKKVIFLIALLSLLLNEYSEAQELLDTILDREESQESRVLFWKGIICIEEGDFLTANKYFTLAYQEGNENDDFRKYFILFKAFSSVKTGEYDDALNLLEEFLDENPNEHFFSEQMADINFLKNSYKVAKQIYTKILTLTQNQERITFKLFLLNMYDMNLENSLKQLKILEKNYKKNYKNDRLVVEALINIQKKNYETAQQLLDESLNNKNSKKNVFNKFFQKTYQGVNYYFQKDYEKAIESFQESNKDQQQAIELYQKKSAQYIIIQNLQDQILQNQVNIAFAYLMMQNMDKYKESCFQIKDMQLQNYLLQSIESNSGIVEIRIKSEKKQISDLFIYDGINYGKKIFLPQLSFHWSEPDILVENISYSDFLLNEFEIENHVFEPVFPWVKSEQSKLIILHDVKQLQKSQNFSKFEDLLTEYSKSHLISEKVLLQLRQFQQSLQLIFHFKHQLKIQ